MRLSKREKLKRAYDIYECFKENGHIVLTTGETITDEKEIRALVKQFLHNTKVKGKTADEVLTAPYVSMKDFDKMIKRKVN